MGSGDHGHLVDFLRSAKYSGVDHVSLSKVQIVS
jgi:hypothetical protein